MKSKVFEFIDGFFLRIEVFKYAFNIHKNFFIGFKSFKFNTPYVTFLGSNNMQYDNQYYIAAREIAKHLALREFIIITEAGHGIMEAANRGAKEGFGVSVGCNTQSEHKQKVNIYIDKYIDVKYDFVKKEILRKYSYAFIFFPGGYGTLNHFFEILNLIKTKKTKKIPIILFGTQFYSNLFSHLKNIYENNIITQEEFQLFFLTDDVNEAISKIEESLINLKSIN